MPALYDVDGVILSIDFSLQVGIIGLRDRSQILFDFSQFDGESVYTEELRVGDEVTCKLDEHRLIKSFVRRESSRSTSARDRSIRRKPKEVQEEGIVARRQQKVLVGVYSEEHAGSRDPAVYEDLHGRSVKVTLVVLAEPGAKTIEEMGITGYFSDAVVVGQLLSYQSGPRSDPQEVLPSGRFPRNGR